MSFITVGVVDDHPLFREGVIRSLSEDSQFTIVGEGSCAMDALAIATGKRPDVLLIDLSMPGDVLATTGDILTASPQTRLLILTASEDADALKASLQAGARGYLLKGVGSRELGEAIRSVHGGSRYVSPQMSAKMLDSFAVTEPQGKDTLTQREREVIELVAQGLSNKHIALKLDLQEKTVKHHMTQILAKLSVSNRTEAALLWHNLS